MQAFFQVFKLDIWKEQITDSELSALCTTMTPRSLIYHELYVAFLLVHNLQILEREKDKNLRRSKNDSKPSIHKYAPGWNELLASASEANVKVCNSSDLLWRYDVITSTTLGRQIPGRPANLAIYDCGIYALTAHRQRRRNLYDSSLCARRSVWAARPCRRS